MEKDISWKEYFQDAERYADVINGIGCGGQQLVTVEDHHDVDTQTILGKMFGFVGKGSRIRMHDAVRKVALGISFAIVGLEYQEIVNYGMPLRCMELDVGNYEKQAGKLRKKVKKQKGMRAGEYLYGFGKDSRISPVVTFVVDIRRLKDTSVFQTDVRQVFDFIQCSRNKQELYQLVKKDESFQMLEEDAYEVMTRYVKADELIQVKDGLLKLEEAALRLNLSPEELAGRL